METFEEIYTFGNTFFTDGLLFFLIRSFVILLLIKLITTSVHKGVKKLNINENTGMQLRFLDSTFRYGAYAFGVFLILSKVRFLEGMGNAVLGATSLISVVLGLAAQEAMGNFVAGFSLIMTHPFKTGDTISLPAHGITGKVTSVNFRHTILQTADQDRVVIPNNLMNTAVVRTLDYGQPYYSALIELSVAYESDTDLVRKAITEAALKVEEVLDTRTEEEKKAGKDPVTVRFSAFLDSGIQVVFRVAVKSFADSFVVTSKVRENVLKKFKQYGIEIPYNKLELVNTEKKAQ